MSDLPDWFEELPFLHQAVLLASMGPWVSTVVVAAVVLGGASVPPLLAGAAGFLLGEVPFAVFLYDRRG